jgi:signal transduction histidine kinase
VQGRIKRGGGGPGDPADREAAIRQQPSQPAPPTSEPGRDPAAGPAGQKHGGPKAGGPRTADAAEARIGRITPTAIGGLRRYGLSNWRIRTRLIALLTLPVIAAIILGGLRIQTSLQSEQQLTKITQLGDIAEYATSLADQLEIERDLLAGALTSGSSRESDNILLQEQTTDTYRRHFITLTDSLNRANLPGGGVDVLAIQESLDKELPSIRNKDFPDGGGSIAQSVSDYDGLIQPLLALSQNLVMESSNSALLESTRAIQVFSQWKEDASTVQSVLTAALASGKPLATQDQAYALTAFNNEKSAQAEFTALYGQAPANNLIKSWASNTNITYANNVANEVLTSPTGFAKYTNILPSYSDWDGDAQSQIGEMTNDETYLVQNLNAQVEQERTQAQTDVIINAALIALVLLVAVIGAAIVARSMVRTLSKLQEAAEDISEHRLPELVRTLSESDPQDVDTSVAPIGIDTTDEIGHVARAFDQVHAQAVRLAAEQALLRGNINAMFTNLSRRSQGLIQRQLSMISELESREADPDQLASLFKLDHLATRMRRNGENLLVLAGEDPGRRWTRPVPLVDVLRAAASEVEQYERIELASVPTAEVAGRVVNDLVHLLAELLENATSFSSPQTRVRVTGHALPDGRVLVEIHDTGIGLSPDDLAEINERLANPPVVDVAVSRRMGLFVVGRLSLRHGIRIQLRPSDSGGTTALVMLPVDVTNAAERRGAGPFGPGGQGGPATGQMPNPQLGQQQGQQRPQSLPGGPQPRGAMAQGPARPPLPGGPTGQQGRPGGRPSLPPQQQQSPQQGLPPRRPNPTLPQGSTALTGQAQLPMGSQPQPGAQPGGQPLPRRGDQPGRPTQQQPQQAQQPQQGQQPPQLPGQPLPTRGRNPQQPQQPQAPQQAQRPGAGQPRPPQSPLDEPSMWGEQPQHGSPAGRPLPMDGQDGTLTFARPHFDDEQQARPVPPQQPMPQQPGPQPQPPNAQQLPQQQPLPRPVVPQQPMPAPIQQTPVPQGQAPQTPAQQDAADHPLTRALPPAEADTARSPIFEAMESNWFRSGRADRMRSVQVYGESAQSPQSGDRSAQPQAPQQRAPRAQSPQAPGPQRPGPAAQAQGQAPGQPAAPQRPLPQRGTPAGSSSTASAAWRTSSNDEVWRRAEQVREPSAGGVMPSGLPRRVPQANLVPGAAETSPDNGPQVSRSPEEVRGRLTNLRRGIQQGRQAGSANPAPDNGPYGTNPQER